MKRISVIISLLAIVALGGAFTETKPTKASLGKALFFDPILSEDSSVSCASCHKPEFAFADTSQFSVGVHGKLGTRNTPTAMNVASRSFFFWDGRASTLSEQALMPIENPEEMNLPISEAVSRLNKSEKYRSMFYKVFGKYPDANTLGAAIAAYEETLETSNTANDRWINDEPNSMTAQQERGRIVFRTKGKCLECHFSPDFTGDEFRAIGIFNGKNYNDSARYHVTKNHADIGKVKVPGLRNVAITAPYMHNGSFKTLREVIDYYDNPTAMIPDGMYRDSLLLEPLHLTEGEKQDLEAFLHALTDDAFIRK